MVGAVPTHVPTRPWVRALSDDLLLGLHAGSTQPRDTAPTSAAPLLAAHLPARPDARGGVRQHLAAGAGVDDAHRHHLGGNVAEVPREDEGEGKTCKLEERGWGGNRRALPWQGFHGR